MSFQSGVPQSGVPQSFIPPSTASEGLPKHSFDDGARGNAVQVAAMQDFRRLHVWKRARAFALDVRRATQSFPPSGYAELKSQIRRASQSIVDNIVEGCGAASRLELARYLDISIKSTSEVDYQLEYARDLGVLPHDVWRRLGKEVIEIRKMLSGLRRAVLEAADRDKKRLPGPKSPARTPKDTGTEN